MLNIFKLRSMWWKLAETTTLLFLVVILMAVSSVASFHSFSALQMVHSLFFTVHHLQISIHSQKCLISKGCLQSNLCSREMECPCWPAPSAKPASTRRTLSLYVQY